MKHVLITGGSDGLGRVLAGLLVTKDYKVTILGKDKTKTAAVAHELGCEYVIANVANYDEVQQALATIAGIDILVNNAGVWIQDALEHNDAAAIRQAVDVNVLGVMNVTHALVEGMKARGTGRIINVISQAGLSAKAERAVYSATKWAITGFTKSMQPELKPFGISVTGFYPGALNTNMFDKSGNSRDMSRALDPAIAADAIAYICGLPGHVDVPEFGIQSLEY